MQSLQTPQVKTPAASKPAPPPASAQPSKGGRLADKIQIALFALVVFAFGIGTWQTPADTVSEDENRTLAPAPKWPPGKPRWRNIVPLPLQFDAFYNDRLMARTS